MDPRYPIGPFVEPEGFDRAARAGWIEALRGAPRELRSAVAGLSDPQLDTPYRDGGWTVRQVVHHLPDSHLNAYLRCRLALTEETPTIRPYEEARWAELPDAREAAVDLSLNLLEALHARWLALLDALPAAAFERRLVHPERRAAMTLQALLALYAWHGRHHVAQITSLRQRRGW
jgi:uncharacterized damage-inducible protein DinB